MRVEAKVSTDEGIALHELRRPLKAREGRFA
jgi:hypothetical protein